MPLSRKQSFRAAAQVQQSYSDKITETVRTALISKDEIEIPDIENIVNALKFINVNEACSDIKQEDLPTIFDECNLRLGGHVIRQKLTNYGIKLHSTGFVDLEVVGKLYVEIKNDLENEASQMDFRSTLKKNKKVRQAKVVKKDKKDDVIPEEQEASVESANIDQTPGGSADLPASEQETQGTLTSHTYSVAERISFSNWINEKLEKDPYVKDYLPIDPNSPTDLFEKCTDGLVLIRMIKIIKASLINDRVINKFTANNLAQKDVFENIKNSKVVFQKIENINLALNTAAAIGCNTVNQDASSILYDANPYLILGLLWQIIRCGLFVEIELEKSLEIYDKLRLLIEAGEDFGKLYSLNPEEILVRWVNYHLEANKNYDGLPIKNFSSDIKDSKAYQCLLEELQRQEKIHNTEFSEKNIILAPNYNETKDLTARAVHVLKMADNLGCKAFISHKDIISGNSKLNTAFVANLFNKKLHLYKTDVDVEDEENDLTQEILDENLDEYQEGDEEKVYKNWINSLDLNSQCNYLYMDLRDGVILLKLIDKISPGIVAWKKKVNYPPFKTPLEGGENCCYALYLAEEKLAEVQKTLGVKLAGCTRGHDINTANPRVLTLGLVWQLMRSYTLSLLYSLASETEEASGGPKIDLVGSDIDETQVLNWVNNKLENFESEKIKNFKDSKLKSGFAIAECLESIRKISNPDGEKIESSYNKDDSKEQKLDNASYLIGVARKMGALVYTLPEHIVRADSKMMLCLFITLMILEKQEILNNYWTSLALQTQKEFAAEVFEEKQEVAEPQGHSENIPVAIHEVKEEYRGTDLQFDNLCTGIPIQIPANQQPIRIPGLRRKDTFRNGSMKKSGSGLKSRVSVMKPMGLALCQEGSDH